MEISGAGLTDVGRTRKHNEDAFLCDLAEKLFIVDKYSGNQYSFDAFFNSLCQEYICCRKPGPWQLSASKSNRGRHSRQYNILLFQKQKRFRKKSSLNLKN